VSTASLPTFHASGVAQPDRPSGAQHLGEGRHVGTACDVAHAVLSAEFLGERPQLRFGSTGHDNSRALACETACDGLSHVAFPGGAQDHRDFAVDASHSGSYFKW
jgi:hypothetical protein